MAFVCTDFKLVMLYSRLSHEMSGAPPVAFCRHATGTLLQRENVPARVFSVVNASILEIPIQKRDSFPFSLFCGKGRVDIYFLEFLWFFILKQDINGPT